MGIKDNFTQAMKELTNPRPSDARKEVRDVASYMNDTADAQQNLYSPYRILSRPRTNSPNSRRNRHSRA